MVKVTFPDGAVREFAAGTTGTTIVEGISKSLAKKTVAMRWNGELADLSLPLESDGKIEFVMRDDAAALELIRHDAAHILAEAVQEIWPTTQVTIGPVIENGFYYDFHREQPFTEDELRQIEKKMEEIVDRGAAFTREVWSREEAKKVRGPVDPDLQAGRVVRPLPWAAHALDQGCGQGLQADQGGGRLLARGLQQSRP
jgi:threonyl-tRNA synthetase